MFHRYCFVAATAMSMILMGWSESHASKGMATEFPSSYEISRTRFRESCRKAAIGSADHCRSWEVKSREDSDLTIDYGYFSRGGSRLLVVQSGIHGAEAYAGAAVQQRLFDKYLDQLLSRGVDVVVIHSLNPYGFKHGRRVDEFNINLNRNFTIDGSAFQTPNPAYTKLRALFEPQGLVQDTRLDSFASHVKFMGAFLGARLNKSYINQGMNSGQYEYRTGLNYGGSELSAQAKFLKSELAPLIERYPRETLFLDIHTGLGENGVLHVMTGLKPAEVPLRKLKELLAPHIGSGIQFTTAQDPGFFSTVGDVIDFVPLLSAHPERVLAVTMEYGTMGTDLLSQLKSASRMVLENQAYFLGCRTPTVCREVRRNFLELFNPTDEKWQKGVLDKADRVFGALVKGF